MEQVPGQPPLIPALYPPIAPPLYPAAADPIELHRQEAAYRAAQQTPQPTSATASVASTPVESSKQFIRGRALALAKESGIAPVPLVMDQVTGSRRQGLFTSKRRPVGSSRVIGHGWPIGRLAFAMNGVADEVVSRSCPAVLTSVDRYKGWEVSSSEGVGGIVAAFTSKFDDRPAAHSGHYGWLVDDQWDSAAELVRHLMGDHATLSEPDASHDDT